MKVRLLILVVVASAMATLTATALSDRGEPIKRDEARAQPTALHAFSVFRGPGAGAVTAQDRGWFARLASGRLDSSTARLARSKDGQRVIVMGGSDLLCMSSREADGVGSLGCTEPTVAAYGVHLFLSVDFLGSGKWRVTGLVPDQVTEIRLQAKGGPAFLQTVEKNVFSMVVSGTPESVTWTAPDGAAHRMSLAGVDG
jgi:hypothetical protein